MEAYHGNTGIALFSGNCKRRKYDEGGRAASCDAADAFQADERFGAGVRKKAVSKGKRQCQSDRGGTDSQEKGGRFAGYGGADRKRVPGNG